MKRIFVSSSDIASVGYDMITQTLEVEFHSGGIYQYHNVPKKVYDELTNAASHGKYFAYNIKNSYGIPTKIK